MSVVKQLKVLGLPKSTYYYKARPMSPIQSQADADALMSSIQRALITAAG